MHGLAYRLPVRARLLGAATDNSAADETSIVAETGVRLIPMSRTKMRLHAWVVNEIELPDDRHTIETVNRRLEKMGIERLYAHIVRMAIGWQSHNSQEKAMIRLLLVDDHPIVLEGLRSIFESSDDCQVIGKLTGSVDLHTRILMHAAELDLVLLDARMPDFDPITTVRALAATHPPLRILILSSYDSPEYVHGLINAGAQGYILKDEPRETLLSAVRIVAAGDMYISPRVARVYVQRQRRYNEARDRLIELTDREREVLRLVGAGHDNEQIGNELTISYDTVKNHLRNIYAKLGVTNRYQAIVFAFRSGLISLE